MKYANGEDIRAGDKVGLGEDKNGVIIGIIDKNKNTDSQFTQEWGYLKNGFMADFPKWGLIYYEKAELDLELIERAKDENMKSVELRKQFSLNEKVIVSHVGGWKQNAKGTIVSASEDVEIVRGIDFYYWVKFDEPQEDINGDDEYSKAQILSLYITKDGGTN